MTVSGPGWPAPQRHGPRYRVRSSPCQDVHELSDLVRLAGASISSNTSFLENYEKCFASSSSCSVAHARSTYSVTSSATVRGCPCSPCVRRLRSVPGSTPSSSFLRALASATYASARLMVGYRPSVIRRGRPSKWYRNVYALVPLLPIRRPNPGCLSSQTSCRSPVALSTAIDRSVNFAIMSLANCYPATLSWSQGSRKHGTWRNTMEHGGAQITRKTNVLCRHHWMHDVSQYNDIVRLVSGRSRVRVPHPAPCFTSSPKTSVRHQIFGADSPDLFGPRSDSNKPGSALIGG